jgi:hypothetical protein
MIDEMFQPATPPSYWVCESKRKCKNCGYEYTCVHPNGNEIVKFQEDGGVEVRWLPTFEVGGYLDLLERMVPNYSREQQITMPIVRKFESEFKIIQEHSLLGNAFNMSVCCECPRCSSIKAIVVSEITYDSPKLKWMKYKIGFW